MQDQTIIIASGSSRFDTNWKNHKITWGQLVEKIRNTRRTNETVAEYLALSPGKQDAIKDIGGFVGGYIEGGHRLNTSIKYRTVLTLDVDSGDNHLWQDFTLMFDSAALVYSTHKHRPESPRLRIVVPLSRRVSPDEYEAVARKVADKVGMDYFDPTTFQPSRLMYWPSTPRDGEYLFQVITGDSLDVDKILDEYADWKDTGTWPSHSREVRSRERSKDKQGNPLEKPGLIGAFCNVYSISGCISEYLSDVYEGCATTDRFTFVGGSTSAGLVVYDDLFAFSHHSTDPASGLLCNAFDLVRVHKFGALDLEADPGCPANRLPSYKAMQDLASQDLNVRRWIGRQRQQEAGKVFGSDLEVLEAEVSGDDDWMEQLDTDRKGNPHETIDNILIILRHDKRLKGRIAYDEFAHRKIVRKSLPWRKITGRGWWIDRDEAGLRHYLERIYEITAVQKIKDALEMNFLENSFHPVRQYLDGLKWDGERRLDELFIDYMGAADTEYTRAVTRKTLTAAVARIYQPGCKFDYVPVLVGAQGIGKSSLFREMAGVWFSDSFSGVGTDSNKAFEQLQGTWIMEIAELAGLKKADVEPIKHYISKQEDRYRPAYGHNVEYHPRQNIFVGSTNDKDGFLRDDTGDRRFWPILCHEQEPVYSVFKDLSEDEINQLWAEAKHYYEQGEPLYLGDLEPEARKMQEAFKVKDERTAVIAAYLETPLPENWSAMSIGARQQYLKDEELYKDGNTLRTRVCVAEIWCELFGGSFRDMTSNNTKHIHSLLSRVPGWIQTNKSARFSIYGKQRIYIRSENG